MSHGHTKSMSNIYSSHSHFLKQNEKKRKTDNEIGLIFDGSNFAASNYVKMQLKFKSNANQGHRNPRPSPPNNETN